MLSALYVIEWVIIADLTALAQVYMELLSWFSKQDLRQILLPLKEQEKVV
jgi:uncharacterized membrane protein YhdT